VYPEPPDRTPFNRWYNHHIEYVLAQGVFHTGYRYVAQEPEPDGTTLHWAFYETDMEGFAERMPAHVQAARSRERGDPTFYPRYVNVLLGSLILERVAAAPAR
jgi:hypothetical protein